MICLSFKINNPLFCRVVLILLLLVTSKNPTSRVLLLGYTFMLAYVISTIGSADSICMVILVLPEAALIKSTYFLANFKAECLSRQSAEPCLLVVLPRSRRLDLAGRVIIAIHKQFVGFHLRTRTMLRSCLTRPMTRPGGPPMAHQRGPHHQGL